MTNKAYDYMTFGDRIAYARHKRGLSQEQLAKLIGICRDRLSYWETGKRDPDVFLLRKIATALEVSEDWLMGNDDNCSMKNVAEDSQYIQLTPKQQQLVTENEHVIHVVYLSMRWKYPTVSYEDIYGDAALELCKAATMYDKNNNNKASFSTVAFSFVKHKMLTYIRSKEIYNYHNGGISLNKPIGRNGYRDDMELGEIIPAPDEWNQLEYKILVESVCQKIAPVLTAKEKEAFRLWLYGMSNIEIAKSLNLTEKAATNRLIRSRKKCKACFNPDGIFS